MNLNEFMYCMVTQLFLCFLSFDVASDLLEALTIDLVDDLMT